MGAATTTGKVPAKKTATPRAPAKQGAQPKALAPVHYKTPSGFEVDISPTVWDDMEVLDLFVEMSSGDDVTAGLAVPRVISKILTPEQKQALYDHLRTPDGRVPIEAISNEIMALISAQEGDAKK